MKYLCLGYYDQSEMARQSREEMDAIMERCQPHMEQLYATQQVVVDAGTAEDIKCVQRQRGKVVVTDGPFAETKEMIGSAVIIEANNIDDAVRIASLHPSIQMGEAECFGWRMEIRSIHYYFEPEE